MWWCRRGEGDGGDSGSALCRACAGCNKVTLAIFQVGPRAWERTTLGDIIKRGGGSIQTGPFGSQLHASDYVPVGVPSIMPVNIGDNRLIRDGIACITEADAQRLFQHIVRKGDIIYSRRGDVERRALVREEEDGWFCGTGCLKVRLGDSVVVPEFASYYLGHPEVREWIVRHAVGATMPNLNTSIMEAIPFLLPPIDNQRAIAAVLGALDDKIEHNRRTARALERLARAIFRAWFVDFEPVKAKAAGATSFPSMPQPVFDALPTRLVDSEIGPVLQGWEVGTVGRLTGLSKTQVKPQDYPKEVFNHFSIPAFDAGMRPVVEPGSAIKSSKFAVIEGCLLLSKLNPRIPRVWLPPPPNGRRQIASTEFLVLVPSSSFDRHYLYCQFQQPDFREDFAQGASGTSNSHQRVRPDDLVGRSVITPPKLIRKEFAGIVDPLFALATATHLESTKLAEIRDYLLPKLLSGAVRVKEAEQILENTP